MRLIRVCELKEGMVLAKDVLDNTGRILLLEGIEIKDTFIDKLKHIGIFAVYVNDSTLILPTTPVIPLSRSETIAATEKALHDIILKKNIKASGLREKVAKLIEDILKADTLAILVSEIQSYDRYTLDHSFNVAVLSIITGLTYGLPKDELVELGIGALLHDVGKIFVSNSILTKKGRLTPSEWEEIKKHPDFGYKVLASNMDISKEALDVVKQHHERINGTGYPHGLRGESISSYGKIAMITDAFDAMTSNRVYKKGITPYKAIGAIKAMRGLLFDNNIVDAFLAKMSSYPVGCKVRLNTGQIGVVIKTDEITETKPTVVLLFDRNGCMYKETKTVSLAKERELAVVGTL